MTAPAADHLDTKALPGEAYATLDDLNRVFAHYREANEDRLAELTTKSTADPLTEEKLARIDAALDETRSRLDALTLKAARPALEGGPERPDPLRHEHKAAFEAYVRSGETAGFRALEAKALSAGSGQDGGYLVPPPAEREMLRRMTQISPIRALATVREISTQVYKKTYSTTGPVAGWVGETAARPQTASQVLAELSFPSMELYAMPSATQTLLDDAALDIETWVASEVETVFAEQEGAAFVTGDGISRPQGFLSPAKVAQASWTWGKLGYVVSGAAGALPAANPSDVLIDLAYALKAGYRQNASFVMNRKTQALVRKLKTTTGEYLWSPPFTPGTPATLMNFPVVEAEDMPDVAADSTAIAFGDFRRAYLIVDRLGIRVMRDPYTAKPYVLFYTTKRVGGGVQDYDALKLLKFGTT
jgi:HK97 family phage major capsid protein